MASPPVEPNEAESAGGPGLLLGTGANGHKGHDENRPGGGLQTFGRREYWARGEGGRGVLLGAYLVWGPPLFLNIYIFLSAPCGTWDPSSTARDGTRASCIGSSES